MIKLTLTDEQAKIVARACEFYARVKIGQFEEILHELHKDFRAENYSARRDEAQRHLFKARHYIYPELMGYGHSYGIGKFDDADQAYDVHQVIRYAMGSKKEPFSYWPLPECEYKKTKKTATRGACDYNDAITCPVEGRHCESCNWNNTKKGEE